MAQLIRSAQAELQTAQYRERVRFYAEDQRGRFLALVEAGFIEQQALYLVKKD